MAAKLSVVAAFFVQRPTEAFCSACIAAALNADVSEVDKSLDALSREVNVHHGDGCCSGCKKWATTFGLFGDN